MLIEPNSPAGLSGTEPLPSEGIIEYPDNPALVRHWRADSVESLNRGAWIVVDSDGRRIDGRGDTAFPIFARSSTKALQALPLVETGAADRFGFNTQELALALASHQGEARHTTVVQGLLQRLGLGVDDLRCGAHRPTDSQTDFELRRDGVAPTRLHNNCSGKHAGFLALASHLGEPAQTYIEPDSRTQQVVRRAVLDMCGCEPDQVSMAIDGCSAPTFRLPLDKLALAFARFSNPEGLEPARRAACLRLAEAVALHPDLIGGTHDQICTQISRVTGGRLFPKIGAEAVYVIGERGGNRAVAIKMDDGGKRGLHAVILHLLRRFDLATPRELDALSHWAAGPLYNYAGLEVGRSEVVE